MDHEYKLLESQLDRDLDYLTQHSYLINQHWGSSTPLFEFVGNTYNDREEKWCGCLTMIADKYGHKAFNNGVEDEGLTELIMKDWRLIFSTSDAIHVESLPIFKKWQLGIRMYFDGKMTLDELAQYVGLE